jgi:hypothetical protein
MNDEVGRVWKKAVMVCIKVLSQYMLWVVDDNHKNAQVGNFTILYLRSGTSRYKAGIKTS